MPSSALKTKRATGDVGNDRVVRKIVADPRRRPANVVHERIPRDDEFGRFFFFNDTATTEIYTLSLHAALPILRDFSQAARFHGLHQFSEQVAVGDGNL